jgi:hypothetical protein
MGNHDDKKKRRPYLYLSLLVNLGVLATFKYYNFFIGEANGLLEYLDINYAMPALNVLLPMGISFYTFQTMSYSIDVYHGKLKPERHAGILRSLFPFFRNSLLVQLNERRTCCPNSERKNTSSTTMLFGASIRSCTVFSKRLLLLIL